MADQPTNGYDSTARTSKDRNRNPEDWQVVNTRANRKKFSFNRRIETVPPKTPNRLWTEERLEKAKPSLLSDHELRQQRLQYHSDTVKNQRSKALYDHRHIFNDSVSSTTSDELNKSKTTISTFKDKMVKAGINFLSNFKSNSETVAKNCDLTEVQPPNVHFNIDQSIIEMDQDVIEEHNEPLLHQTTNEYGNAITFKDGNQVLPKMTTNFRAKAKQQPSLTLRFKGEHLEEYKEMA